MALDNKKFLDKSGVTKLWEQIQNNLNTKINSLDTTEDIVIASKDANDIVTLKAGVKEVDGIIQQGTGSDITLAKVAATGAAEDVAFTKAQGSNMVAANVNAAINELKDDIDALDTASDITLTEAAGSGDVLKVYTLAQGGTEVGTINIPKDMVATNGSLVHGTLDNGTFTPQEGGHAYIQMTIANGDPFYIDVADLIENSEFDDSAEIDFTVTNGRVSADIKSASIERSKIAAGFEADIAALEGKHATGKTVAQEVADGIAALDANLDAVTDSTVTDAEKVAVMTGVTEVDGVITAVDSVDVDLAGAASRAKAAVIGNSNDETTDMTLYGVKAYAAAAVAALDATPSQTADDSNGGLALSLTQVDGVVTGISGSITSLSDSDILAAIAAATA